MTYGNLLTKGCQDEIEWLKDADMSTSVDVPGFGQLRLRLP
jgi:hypothetical protein